MTAEKTVLWGAEEEILQVTAEECNEVAIEVSKAFRFGLDHEHDGTTTKEKLTKEVGDLLCMIDLLIERDLIYVDDLDQYQDEKLAKLKKNSPVIFEDFED